MIIRKLVSFGTRHTMSSQDDPLRGIGAARRWIKSELDKYSRESGGRLVVTEDEFEQPPGRRVPRATKLVNVVATLPGSQPESKDRLYVVSGHYDSICSPGSDAECDAPGASDDASGTAAVMEMARVMSKYQFNNFEVTLVFRRDRYGRGGDHIPFLQRGYAAVRFTEPNEDFTRQHQKVRVENGVKYGDVVEMVDFGYVAQVARINAAAMASLALAPAAPAGVGFKTGRQEYDTVLAWRPNAEPDVAGYRIVWRETHQPFWQRGVEVGTVNEFVMKGLSKDDFFFAVQAIDKDGNGSVPAFPRPRSN